MARSSLRDVEKESLKRPALVFTDSDSLANTVQKDPWTQSHQDGSGPSVVSYSEKGSEQWKTFSLASGCRHTCEVADPLTKTDGRV